MTSPTKRVRKVKRVKAWAVVSKRGKIPMAFESYTGNGDYELCIYNDKDFAKQNCCESIQKVVEVQITYHI